MRTPVDQGSNVSIGTAEHDNRTAPQASSQWLVALDLTAAGEHVPGFFDAGNFGQVTHGAAQLTRRLSVPNRNQFDAYVIAALAHLHDHRAVGDAGLVVLVAELAGLGDPDGFDVGLK